jgi:hypothetical protein
MTMPRDDAGNASETGQGPAETDKQPYTGGTRAQVRDVKDKVVDQARSSLRQARDSAASSLNDSRKQAADTITTIASAVRGTGDRLRTDNQTSVADLTDSLADHVERLSSYLRERDLRAVRDDLQAFARRQPAVAVGVALAIGVLGARFIKSSRRSGGGSPRRDDAPMERRDYGTGGYAGGAYGGA